MLRHRPSNGLCYNKDMNLRRLALLLLIICFTTIIMPKNTNALADDYHFTDYLGNLHLSKDNSGISHLKVNEDVTIMFPESSNIHDFCWEIPYQTRKDGETVLEHLDKDNLIIRYDGAPLQSQTVEKIEENEFHLGYYKVCVKTHEELAGEQNFSFEYELKNVVAILPYASDDQFLLWNSYFMHYGTSVDEIRINLSMSDEILQHKKGGPSCQISGIDDGCSITKNKDGFTFSAENLSSEDIHLNMRFYPNTFEVSTQKDYYLIWAMLAVVVPTIVLLIRCLLLIKESHKQRKLYYSLPVAPQYCPPEDILIHVAEGKQIYLKKTKPSYVATLLELAVSNDITILDGKSLNDSKENKWSIKLNVDPDEANLSPSQYTLLSLLANADSKSLAKGETINIKKRSRQMVDFIERHAKTYKRNAQYILDQGGYLVASKIPQRPKIKNNLLTQFLIAIGRLMFILIIIPLATLFYIALYSISLSSNYLVGLGYLPIILLIVLILSLVAYIYCKFKYGKFAKYTDEGVRLVRYLEGLELYIKMAEKERLIFLQSVEGAEKSEKGVVELREKLLPWASLFGSEESWVKEFRKYHTIEDDTTRE